MVQTGAGNNESVPTFRNLMQDRSRFVVAVELETSRGVALAGRAQRVFEYARRLADSRLADAFTLTDNPGGHPHLRPETLGRALLELKREVVVNVSCKDYNRNGLESRLWSLASAGFENIMCLSGDYPAKGIGGQARPVFDVDSAGLLEMVRQIGKGVPGAAGNAGPDFFAGAAVNPYKLHEGEYVPQLQKMRLKARAGARWFVTQIGYDARKQDELLRWAAANDVDAPFLGTVFPLGIQSAKAFHGWTIPGVCVPGTLLAVAEEQAASPDKGRKFFIELAARQVAIFRGLGYRGVHLSGRPDFERVSEVLELERTFGRDDWKQFAREVQYPQPGEFYLYERDGHTGLSTGELNRQYAAGLGRRRGALRRLAVSPAFQLGRAAHAIALSDRAPGAGIGRAAYRLIEKSGAVTALAHAVERAIKLPMYGCRDCGDCSLPESAYLCPESQCAKNQRNGPCGGTKAGRCEVLDKDCIWLRAYDRLKLFGEEERMLDGAPVLCDASLRGTSSWANAVLGRDHTASATGASNDAASH